MSVTVIEWPPVGLTATETTISRQPVTIYGMSGTPRFQQSQPTRTIISAVVSGISRDQNGAGYIEALKLYLDGILPLVQVRPKPRFWLGNNRAIGFVRESTELLVDGQSNIEPWASPDAIHGAAGSDAFPYLDCTGFPPSRKIATPGEAVTVGGTTTFVIRPATSDANGAARVYTKDLLSDGLVSFGEPKRVFLIPNFARAVQPVSADYQYQFEMVEMFASEFSGGFSFVDPWGVS